MQFENHLYNQNFGKVSPYLILHMQCSSTAMLFHPSLELPNILMDPKEIGVNVKNWTISI